jgi:hypothetical protein
MTVYTFKHVRARRVHIFEAGGGESLCGNWHCENPDAWRELPVPKFDMCKECLRRSDQFER